MKSVIIVLIALISVAVCVGLAFLIGGLIIYCADKRYWDLRHKKQLTAKEQCELEDLEYFLNR